ncbi:CbtB domain-containing protein [Motiliproteus sediminis]|uniref:CbtB domain-containing protein n=1 Tax=Motiliproteus sediminis TaxID=1468178 RepID=UPI001AEFD619|nr:CbtB domain-containing protein [Motiliproteus sediminis]
MQFTTPRQNPQNPDRSALMTAAALIVFGSVIVFMVGFLPADSIHSIAHDVRHLTGFPCH